MTFPDLQTRVITLAIKLNQTDLLSDLQYLTESQWLGVYFMLVRMQGG